MQGMVEKLDYLQALGVNAIELLPIFEFNELEYYSPIPGTNLHRFNFWGYSTSSFFAPMARFSAQVRHSRTLSCRQPVLKHSQFHEHKQDTLSYFHLEGFL